MMMYSQQKSQCRYVCDDVVNRNPSVGMCMCDDVVNRNPSGGMCVMM